jgi:hypothetical protein
MSRKRPNIPVAVQNDDGCTIVGSEELRAQREAGQPFPQGAWPNNDTAARIIGDLVNDNNRSALRRQIHHFRVAYLEYAANKGPLHKARKRKLARIARHSKALLELLSNREDRLLEYYLFLFSPPTRDEALFQLAEIHKAARTPPPAAKNAVKEWCVMRLADIYEQLGKRASVKRPGALDIGGPFPQFVEAVSKEIGIEISPETIAPALAKRRLALAQRRSVVKT